MSYTKRALERVEAGLPPLLGPLPPHTRHCCTSCGAERTILHIEPPDSDKRLCDECFVDVLQENH